MICTRICPGIQRINTDICNITIEPSLKYANKNHVNRYINKVYVSTKKKRIKWNVWILVHGINSNSVCYHRWL